MSVNTDRCPTCGMLLGTCNCNTRSCSTYPPPEMPESVNLICFGCAHSRANDPFPGSPSGERPCLFCIRNQAREKYLEEYEAEYPDYKTDGKNHPVLGKWYDGSKAVKLPMDCYHSVDMLNQMEEWQEQLRRKYQKNALPADKVRELACIACDVADLVLLTDATCDLVRRLVNMTKALFPEGLEERTE